MPLSHWPFSGVFESRETGASLLLQTALSWAPSALDLCPILRLKEVYGSCHNISLPIPNLSLPCWSGDVPIVMDQNSVCWHFGQHLWSTGTNELLQLLNNASCVYVQERYIS